MIRRLLYGFLQPINTNLVVLLGLWTATWGLWVASPFWDVFDSAQMFTYMHSLGPEWAWGVSAVIAGLVMVFGVIFNSYRSLSWGAMIGFIYWLAISVLYFLGDWQNTGGITVIIFAIYSAAIRINLSVNRNHFEHLR